MMTRLKKLNDDMATDHDVVVKVDQSLEFLKTLDTANAISIQQTDINIKGLTTALGEVKETADKAFCMASQALPTITSHRVKLDRLEDDVSRLNVDFDGLKSPHDHTPQIDLLEADVSQISAAVEELRTQITSDKSAPVNLVDTHTVTTKDTSTSTATRDNARMQRTAPPESDNNAMVPSATAATGDNARTQLKHPPEFDNNATLPSENAQGPP